MDEWMRWGIGGIVGGFVALLWWLGRGRIERIEAELKEVRMDMETYKENCGIGKAALDAMSSALTAHIEREETVLWAEIREDRKLNNEAHAELVKALGLITGRIIAVETILDERLPAKTPRRKGK